MEEKDYKKLYEDVVALAKDGLKDGLYLSRSAKDVTEFLFPQLKETEEEKARKGLVRFLINFNNGCYSKPSETEIDAWIKWINKKCEQSEQESADEVKPKFMPGEYIRYRGENYKIENIEKCGNNFIYNVSIIGEPSDPEEVKNAIGIGGEKDMVKIEQPQSQQEWSKEDIERLDRIHQFMWANRKGDTDEIYQQEQDADWLMALKHKKHWKPTEEQMKALELEIIGRRDSLYELYLDLEDLKNNKL